jgi:hypothetical protein
MLARVVVVNDSDCPPVYLWVPLATTTSRQRVLDLMTACKCTTTISDVTLRLAGKTATANVRPTMFLLRNIDSHVCSYQ